MKTRQWEKVRNERAEKVCRELRYQFVAYGGIGEADVIMKLLNSWMKTAKQNKYVRPKLSPSQKAK